MSLHSIEEQRIERAEGPGLGSMGGSLTSSTVGARITLRRASSIDDVRLLEPLAKEFHAESRFAKYDFSSEKREALYVQALEQPALSALVIAELEGVPVGYVYCSVGEYIVGTGSLLTTVQALYVREPIRKTLAGGKTAARLLASVVNWSKKNGAIEVLIHVTSGIDVQKTDKFLNRAKFQLIGGNYALPLTV